MSEFGGEIYSPGEDVSSGSENLSEEAAQRFAAAAAAIKQVRKEEKKSKKRDDQVAQAIMKFLGGSQQTQLFVLISRLVARDCPSIFILALLSLIDDDCLTVVQAHLQETVQTTAAETVDSSMELIDGGSLDTESNRDLIEWITRLQLVLSTDPENILLRLMVDDKNIDGTVLQLATFIIQSYFENHKRTAPFEKLQSLTASILQTVFQPFIGSARKALQERAAAEASDSEEE